MDFFLEALSSLSFQDSSFVQLSLASWFFSILDFLKKVQLISIDSTSVPSALNKPQFPPTFPMYIISYPSCLCIYCPRGQGCLSACCCLRTFLSGLDSVTGKALPRESTWYYHVNFSSCLSETAVRSLSGSWSSLCLHQLL